MSRRPLRFYQPAGGAFGGGGFVPSASCSTVGPDATAGAAASAAVPANNETLSASLAAMFAARKAQGLTANSVLVGLLFARPSDDFAAKNIIPELDYFDTRSGESLDFFCVGYSKTQTPLSQAVIKVKGVQWWFDNDSFDKFRRQITRESNWKYSGETELLLADAKWSDSKASIDYSSAIPCLLEDMQNDKAFKNIKSFFENVFTYAEDPGSSPAFDLSDLFGKKILIGAAKNTILQLLLRSAAPEYYKARHFVLTDLSKRN